MNERLKRLQENAKHFLSIGLLSIALLTLLVGCDKNDPNNQKIQASPIPEPGATLTYCPPTESPVTAPLYLTLKEAPQPAATE